MNGRISMNEVSLEISRLPAHFEHFYVMHRVFRVCTAAAVGRVNLRAKRIDISTNEVIGSSRLPAHFRITVCTAVGR